MKASQKISKIININIEEYFKEVVNFFYNYNSLIKGYYTDSSVIYPKEAFDTLTKLEKTGELILEKIRIYKGYFKNVEYWDLLDKMDDILLKFDFVRNYSKFYKADSYRKEDTEKDEKYILTQNQTLENLADQRGDKWDDIALNNYLNEEDYTPKGGVKLILKKNNANLNVNDINSIIDVTIGENLLGKDFPEYLEIDPYEEDMTVLSPQSTFVHTIKRLLELKQGSIPEDLTLGVRKDIVTEVTQGKGYFFPILLRQLSNSLQTDDTIFSFSIVDTYKKEDNYYIKIECYNRLSERIEVEEILE